jgi:tripartite-type tricarboxylate transporter receptor subunit TctC
MNRFFRALTVFAGVLGFLTSAAAQNYPSRPITIIVPFPPGGATDVLARFLGERLRERLGPAAYTRCRSTSSTTWTR